jgi:hypothetical protein
MSVATPKFKIDVDENARQAPVRLVVVQGEQRPAVEVVDEPQVMTMPHLLVREAVALIAFSLFLAALAIFIDAPLEEIANAQKTPNPAKAPWYFLGLQELLHYYPPLVSGVVLPTLVVVALVVIPYFNINLERRALWSERKMRKLGYLWIAVAALSAVFLFTGSYPVWPILIPLWMVALAMSAPAIFPSKTGARAWLGDRSLSFWVFLWFLLASTALTVIGVAFRGPGWEFTLPWRDGIY